MRVNVRTEWIRELFGMCGPEVLEGRRPGVKGEGLPVLLGFRLVWLASGVTGLPVLEDILGCVGSGQRGGWDKNWFWVGLI